MTVQYTGVAVKNVVNAAPQSTREMDELAIKVLQDQLNTESDVHIYQTPRRQQHQQQSPVASL